MVKVLIVDDDIAYLNAITEGLTAMGHEVVTANSRPEALAILQNVDIDVALLDMIMEGGGAISLTHDIRARNYTVPIIIITGRPQIADSPVFQRGLRETSAKIVKTASLAEIDALIRKTVRS